MNKLQYLKQYTLQKFGIDLLMVFVPFSKVRTWNTFSVRLTIFIKFIMEEESNAELVLENKTSVKGEWKGIIWTALLVKSSRELLTITARLSQNNKHKPQIPKRKKSQLV